MMKITGTKSYIKFDLENGYILKADGELLTGNRFVVYIDSIKYWEPPYESQVVTPEEICMIIEEVKEQQNETTMQIFFE